jgi:hypothetical protein
MRKLIAILICTTFALSACGVPTGDERPEDKKLRDSIYLLINYMQKYHPKSVNWENAAVKTQLEAKLPKGYATEAGWTIKWSSPKSGELPQVVIPWELLGQFPTKPALDINDYTAGKYPPQSVALQIAKLQKNDDPYFAGIVNVKMSKLDKKWVVFTSVPYLPVTDPAYGWAHFENNVWKIVDFGTATVGCGITPAEIQSEFGFSCLN